MESELNLTMEIFDWPQPVHTRVPIAEPNLSEHERKKLLLSFDSTWIGSNSRFVRESEEQFLRVLEFPEKYSAVIVSNGSVALTLALEALGVQTGDEVIVPTLTYAACASTIITHGAIPVFCDVNQDTWQISIAELMEKVTTRTKVILLCHTYGVPSDYAQIIDWARSRNIKVIEDCSEALGGRVANRHVGTQGDIATFSFFPNKLITSGEGGMCVTNDPDLEKRLRLLRGQGMSLSSRYWFLVPGFNFRITGLQAGILIGQLDRFTELFNSRQNSEEKWVKTLGNYVVRPTLSDNCSRAPWLFSCTIPGMTVRTKKIIVERLANSGIETRPVFYPLDIMPAFSKYGTRTSPVSESIANLGITLPTGFHVKEETYIEVGQLIKETLDANN